ncbi:ead/Ea22-like family protein [Escherichia coli]
MSKIDYQALRERYSPKPVPECSVCGEEMSIQRISGAHVVYACSSYGGDGDFKIGRTLADEHYEKSRVTVVDDSDPDVIALLDELEAAKSKLNEQREYYEGVISDGNKRIAELEAREILLPERSSMLHRTDFHDDYQTVMAYKVSEVIAAIRAAGIRIKGGE